MLILDLMQLLQNGKKIVTNSERLCRLFNQHYGSSLDSNLHTENFFCQELIPYRLLILFLFFFLLSGLFKKA